MNDRVIRMPAGSIVEIQGADADGLDIQAQIGLRIHAQQGQQQRQLQQLLPVEFLDAQHLPSLGTQIISTNEESESRAVQRFVTSTRRSSQRATGTTWWWRRKATTRSHDVFTGTVGSGNANERMKERKTILSARYRAFTRATLYGWSVLRLEYAPCVGRSNNPPRPRSRLIGKRTRCSCRTKDSCFRRRAAAGIGQLHANENNLKTAHEPHRSAEEHVARVCHSHSRTHAYLTNTPLTSSGDTAPPSMCRRVASRRVGGAFDSARGSAARAESGWWTESDAIDRTLRVSFLSCTRDAHDTHTQHNTHTHTRAHATASPVQSGAIRIAKRIRGRWSRESPLLSLWLDSRYLCSARRWHPSREETDRQCERTPRTLPGEIARDIVTQQSRSVRSDGTARSPGPYRWRSLPRSLTYC